MARAAIKNTEKRSRYALKNQEDKELIKKWRQEKDMVAGDTFVLKYNSLIYDIALKYPKIPLDECISEGFFILKMCMNCYNIDRDTPFSTYFITAYRNRLNMLNKHRRYNQNALDLDQDLENFQDKKQAEVFEEIEKNIAIEAFLKRLSETERELFVSYYGNSETIDNLAKKTGFSKEKTKELLENILKKVRKEVA
jgi:RNA polymerase sigma factor (sigma-70 family)